MSSLIATWKPTYPYLYRPDSVRVKDYSLSHLELLRSGKYSDLTLRCGNAEWHVHRFVLCPRSKYFTAACDGDFEEAHSGIIELKDVDVSSMERVLLWLYTLDYPYPVNATPSPKATPSQETVPPTLISNPDSNDDVNLDTAQEIIRFQTMSVSTSADLENQETNRLVIHARVYALADRFDIPELRQLTIENFNKFAPYRALDSDDFVAAALEVLRSTPLNDSGLRPIVKRICARYLDSIRTDRVEMRAGRIIDSKSWESIFKEDVDFTWEVMKTAAAMHRADLDAQQPTIDNGLALAKLADIAQRDSCIICRKAFRPLFEVVQSADTPRRVQLRCSHCNQAYRSEEFAEPW